MEVYILALIFIAAIFAVRIIWRVMRIVAVLALVSLVIGAGVFLTMYGIPF